MRDFLNSNCGTCTSCRIWSFCSLWLKTDFLSQILNPSIMPAAGCRAVMAVGMLLMSVMIQIQGVAGPNTKKQRKGSKVKKRARNQEQKERANDRHCYRTLHLWRAWRWCPCQCFQSQMSRCLLCLPHLDEIGPWSRRQRP